MPSITSLLPIALLAINGAFAHPGHDVAAEALERREWIQARSPKSVRSCAAQLKKRGHMDAALARRQEMAKQVRVKRGIETTKRFARRDFAEYNISHASDLDVTYGSDETLLFEDNSSCILQPEVTQGPYYIDGELIRSDITEGQEGVPFYLDIQIVDTSSCEPVPAVFMDIWHCNSTGVYSGVAASGNGNQDDTSNLSNTFLRGIQPTDVNGVAQFHTTFPGHYTGRAPHIHVLTHNTNSTIIRTNNTLLEGYGNFSTSASHVGQIFFDQDLISTVEATAPYNTNTQDLTTNSEDTILASEAADMDPFVEYVMLGDDITDGILAWISIGIDPTADEEITSAGTSYEDGGVANSDSGTGGSGGGGGSGGAAPSGGMSGMPTGSAPTGAVPSGTTFSTVVSSAAAASAY